MQLWPVVLSTALIWKKSEDKSVQLVRVAFFRSDFLQNPYFNNITDVSRARTTDVWCLDSKFFTDKIIAPLGTVLESPNLMANSFFYLCVCFLVYVCFHAVKGIQLEPNWMPFTAWKHTYTKKFAIKFGDSSTVPNLLEQ